MTSIVKEHVSSSAHVAEEPIQVLHIIKSLGRGGAETLLPETLTKHDKERFSFHYIYFLPWKFQMVSEIENAGGKVTCFSAKNNLRIMSQVFKLAAYVRKNNIRLIHCHLPWAGIVGRVVGKMTGVPVVYTEHNTWERYHKLTFLLNKLSFSSQKKVIAVSKEVENSIRVHYKKKNPEIQVVLNGVNTQKFSDNVKIEKDVRAEFNIPADAIVIGTACVFRKQKRLTTWLEICSRLHKQFPNTYFLLVGDGVMKDEVFAKVKELGTEKYVFFPGLQPEIRPYLKAMDIFMMSSEFEGLPIALLESMSMGCMPACTAAGGIPELIKDNKNGILVPVSDPLQLSDRLSEYLSAPARITEAGNAARETVINHFDMQKMVNELESIYNNVLN